MPKAGIGRAVGSLGEGVYFNQLILISFADYTGINKHEGEDVGLYDTVLSPADFKAAFVNEDPG